MPLSALNVAGKVRNPDILEERMKFTVFAVATALTGILLSGCAYESGPRGDRVAVGVGVGYYDGYYDDYYGPFNDGYWGDDGFFYYADTNRGWHRDEGHHFRRDAFNGFHAVHGSGVHREH